MEPLTLTRKQAQEIDRRAAEELGLLGLVLMENAGRGVADKLCEIGIEGKVIVLCGKGNNGGDGFVIARHLELRDYAANVCLFAEPGSLVGDAAVNCRVLERSGIPVRVLGPSLDEAALAAELARADWIVDALLGTGARGEPRTPIDRVIELCNAAPARKLAVDLPSGLDCDTGRAAKSTFRADHTSTFVGWKAGFLAPEAKPYLGAVHVHDIGVPRRLVEDVVGTTK
jgi:NAD(P)H-hydrate epimerase